MKNLLKLLALKRYNMIKKEKILKTLNEHLEYAKAHLGLAEDRVIGIFLYGSQNYGTDIPQSDIDSKIIVLPSFEDFCLRRNNLYSKELILEDGSHIDVKDIRLYRENLLKQNINFVELLFTEYRVMNPLYENLFDEYFVANREDISKLNRQKAILSMGHQAIHTLKQGLDDDKKLYNGHRLLFFLQKYVTDKPYLECLKPSGAYHSALMEMRAGTFDYAQPKLDAGKNLVSELENFMIEYEEIDSPRAEAGITALDRGVVEILRKSFNPAKEEEISREDFFSHLTNAEIRAYYSIIRQIHAEGNVTISKLVQANSISRPVYNNLLTKMKEHNIAEISNMGAKGTYIRINQAELKAEALNFN